MPTASAEANGTANATAACHEAARSSALAAVCVPASTVGVADEPIVNRQAQHKSSNTSSSYRERRFQHLAALVGSKAKITLEVEVEVPDGVPDGIIRTVTENCRTLKFTAHGFEEE